MPVYFAAVLPSGTMRRLLVTLCLCLAASPLAAQDAPDNSTGLVYLFRVEEADKFNSGKPKVWIDDRLAVMMPESEFIGVRLPPGRHVFRMQNKGTVTPLTIEAGRTYFIRVSEVPAHGYLRNLFVATPEQAAEQMRGLKPLEDKNIKDRALKTTKEKP
jgi:hypothetical protein